MPDFSQPLQDYLSRKPSWLTEVASLGVHSTHEHLHTEAQRLERGPDPVLWLLLYLPTDLAGTGVPLEVLDQLVQPLHGPPAIGVRELDPAIINAFAACRHTGYGEAIRRTASLFGGSAELTRENLAACIPELEKRLMPGYYERQFARCGLLSVQTNSFDREQDQRLPVRRAGCHPFHFKDLHTDGLLDIDGGLGASCLDMAHQEKGIRVDSLDSWEALIERYFADDASQCIAVKSAIAYWRPLDFEPVEREEAQRAVQKLLASKETADSSAESAQLLRRTFQNYGIRFIVKLAGQYGLPMKFHTGGYAGYADAARPLRRMRENLPDLAPLIADFPETNFILFHHCYPYGEAAVLLAKHCANCFIDQSWTWIVNPGTASRYLSEFLLGAPSNKLFFFGGDHPCLELTLGHLDVARQGLCITLERLVNEGWATPHEALQLARRVCYENQEALFPVLRQFR